MRESWALIRATWLTAASYRIGMVVSLFGLALAILPLYLIANALDPTMQGAISGEAHEYFGFVVIGAICFSLASSCTTALPSAIDGAIGRGTLEVILGTPARLGAICVGFMGYGVLSALLRATMLLAFAWRLGTSIVWGSLPLGFGVLLLTMLTYAGFGLIFAAMIMVFRTTGPLTTAVLTGSMFLGGVYYPTSVIPSWIRDIAGVLPLTYGLRALRRIVLRGDSLAQVSSDVQILAAMTTVTLALGTLAFCLALRRARCAGTLSSY